METLYTVEEAARFLRVNPPTVRRWVKEGKLRASWAGQRLVFTEGELKDFLQPAGTASKT
jgi:excisionase family DNA binding protein